MPNARPVFASRPRRRPNGSRRGTSDNFPRLGDGKNIQFEDFPTWDSTPEADPLDEAQLQILGDYLSRRYGIWRYFIFEPFIFLCMPNKFSLVPPPELSPFTIVGYMVIWIHPECDPFQGLRIWHYVKTNTRHHLHILNMGPGTVGSIAPFEIPTKETLYAIGQGFPEATHISYYNSRIVIELPRTNPQDYRQRLQTLPALIPGTTVRIYYHNGPLDLPIVEDPSSLVPNPETMLYGQDFSAAQLPENCPHNLDRCPTVYLKCCGKRVGLAAAASSEGSPQHASSTTCQGIFMNSEPQILRSYLCLSPIRMHPECPSDNSSATMVDVEDGAVEGSGPAATIREDVVMPGMEDNTAH